MNANLKHSIFIVSGKNPLNAHSGYASYSYNLAKLISELKYQVEIFCLGDTTETVKSKIGLVNIIGSKIFSKVLKDVEMAGLLFLAPKLALSMIKKMETDSSTIIWGIGPWSLTGALVKLFYGKKIIFLADYFTSIKHEYSGTVSALRVADHGLWIKAQAVFIYLTLVKLYSVLEWFLLKKSNKIITHYESTEEILGRQFKLSKDKFVRLPYFVGASKQETSSRSKLPFKPLIISVLRHDGRKGINFLLHSFAILNSKKLKYFAVIIGEGKLRNKHLQLAEKLGLKNIYQPGLVPDLKPYLKKADLFVFPSIEEGGSSLAILEATKVGLPIVSTNVDGIPEDLKDGRSALLVAPKDPLALSLAIEKLLKNKALAKKLAKEAKKNYYKKHSLLKSKRAVAKLLGAFF